MAKNNSLVKAPDIEILCDNRFFVRLPKRFGIHECTVRTCDRPSLSAVWSDDNENIIGYKWNPVTITVIHPSTTHVSKKIFDWIAFDIAKLSRKDSDKQEKNNMEIEMLGLTGEALEKWILEDCTILSVDFGTCDYNEDRKSKTTLILQPKDCKFADMVS